MNGGLVFTTLATLVGIILILQLHNWLLSRWTRRQLEAEWDAFVRQRSPREGAFFSEKFENYLAKHALEENLSLKSAVIGYLHTLEEEEEEEQQEECDS